MRVEFRKIKKSELEEGLFLDKYAFGSWTDDDPKPEDTDWIDLDEVLIASVDGKIAAKVLNLAFDQVVRGVIKPMGGISGVACYPEYRRRGLIRQLMLDSFADMRKKGQVVSTLYPFLENFYTRFGYVTGNNHLTVKLQTQTFAHFLPKFKGNETEWSYSRHRARDEKEAWLTYVRAVATNQHGFTFHKPTLPDSLWKMIAKDQHVLYVKHNGRILAGARFHIKGFMDSGEIKVREMYWQSLEARDRLFGYLAAHADAAPFTWLPLRYGTNFHVWSEQPTMQLKADINFVVMMGRVIDVVGALIGLPAPMAGELVIDVTDEQCAWNNGRYKVVAANGRLSATTTDQSAHLHLTIQALSALIYGALSVNELVHRGWLTGASNEALNLLQVWFPETAVFNTNAF
ncbi:MAG: GNAT family N-acetyltransferase [Chloroflexi bacterium]|nr:GNAT family N-acetyltransferase [Chloroflexota bacterium]